MRTQRMMISLIAVSVMLALLWQARASADTLGVYQSTVSNADFSVAGR